MDSEGTAVGVYKSTGYIPACYEELITRGIPLDKNIFLNT